MSAQSQIGGEHVTASPAHAGLPSLQYSTRDLMMVLVNMQKEAQRREESFHRSLMQLKEKLKSQVRHQKPKCFLPVCFSGIFFVPTYC